MKTTILILSLILISLSSCITQRRCNDKFPPEQSVNIKDSTVITYETKFRDSVVKVIVNIPKTVIRDSVVVRYEGGKCTSDKLTLTGKYSQAEVWMQNSILKGELTEGGWIPLQVKITMQERYIKELRQKSTEKQTVKMVEYIPKWKLLFFYIGLGAVCIAIGFGIKKLIVLLPGR